MGDPCPFCSLPTDRIIHRNERAVAIRDGFPVSPGHTLIIPRRHTQSFFEATPEEVSDMLDLLRVARDQLQGEFDPDGFNIGINDGEAAGQTVMHLHLHLIPRFDEDVPESRGGVRWIFPGKADYWSDTCHATPTFTH